MATIILGQHADALTVRLTEGDGADLVATLVDSTGAEVDWTAAPTLSFAHSVTRAVIAEHTATIAGPVATWDLTRADVDDIATGSLPRRAGQLYTYARIATPDTGDADGHVEYAGKVDWRDGWTAGDRSQRVTFTLPGVPGPAGPPGSGDSAATERVLFYVATGEPATESAAMSTFRGAPSVSASGLSGGALNSTAITFGGSGGEVIADGTIEGFLTLPSSGSLRVALSRDETFWVGSDGSGNLIANYGYNNFGGTETEQTLNGPSIPTGVRKHFALQFSGGIGSLYFDGALVDTGDAPARHAAPITSGLVLGGLAAAGAYDWQGSISNVRTSSVLRYGGSYAVPIEPFAMDASTLALIPLTTNSNYFFLGDAAMAYEPRPDGLRAGLAKYKGPSRPTNWLEGDEWVKTP